MLIGIEAERANLGQKTGVEHYAKQLILHLAKIDQRNQYRLYLRSKPEDWFLELPKNFELRIIPFPLFWTQVRVSLELLIHPVDALFIPASALPLIHPKNSLVTVHDLAWKFYPETFTGFTRWFLNWSTGFAGARAKKIIAVSESTKKDLIKFYHLTGKKITVIHHGFTGQEQQVLGGEQVRSLPEKYILFLSTIQPRKNLSGLIEAFLLLKKEHPELPHKLVVVGKPGWKYEKILEQMDLHKDVVLYFNHVTDADKAEILARAQLMVLPSFYEGFGMTILESFACNVPVATAKVSSMPEVAGEAAVYFDPHDILDIKKAMEQVLLSSVLSEELKTKGKHRLRKFSWEKCAAETLRAIEYG